jgi:HlyD family secretion protein
MRRVVILGGGGVLVIVVLALTMSWPRAVTVAEVVKGRAIQAVYATGMVEADPRVEIKARSSGTIKDLTVREGSTVARDSLLARIENRSLSYELVRGQVDLRAANARAQATSPQVAELEARRAAQMVELAQAEDELRRNERLRAAAAIAEEDYERQKRKADRLRAEVAAQDARIKATRADLTAERARMGAVASSLRSQVEDSFVRSPLEGTVLRRRVEVGEAVAAGQLLFTVGDTRRLVLEVKIDEADVGQVRLGQRVAVNLYAWPGRVFRGRINDIYPDAERETKTFLGKVVIDEPPAGLRSGMSAEVNIVVAEKAEAVLVPAAAVQGLKEAPPERACGAPAGGACYEGRVLVLSDGRARSRGVTLGLRDVRSIEVLAGVAPGERVIVLGGKGLKDGARVRVR